MYRTIGLYMNRKGFSGAEEIAAHVNDPAIDIRFVDGVQHMILDGEDVSEAIRTPEASMLASSVSAVPEVRVRLVELQREFAKGNSVVMDGRDIGTVVLPDATLKIFLTASPEVRAKRRFAELQAKGAKDSFEQVLSDIQRRDHQDSTRAIAPLKAAKDAVTVDTSNMDIDDVVETIRRIVMDKVGA
jgi:cytidylate kinase